MQHVGCAGFLHFQQNCLIAHFNNPLTDIAITITGPIGVHRIGNSARAAKFFINRIVIFLFRD